MGLRAGDPSELSYLSDFTTWKQQCIEFPGRQRDLRRSGRGDLRLKRCQYE